MTIQEAKEICRQYHDINDLLEADKPRYEEALHLLINKTGKSSYMADLGAYYYKQHDDVFALLYYEKAAAAGNLCAIANLGHIWYYGTMGKRDFRKAFYYLDQARRMGDPVAAYMVADMYKYGFYGDPDYEKFTEIIVPLYAELKYTADLNDPFPEVALRRSEIFLREGQRRRAWHLYRKACRFLAERLQNRPCSADRELMCSLIRNSYCLQEFDPTSFGLYDLYYVLQKPARVRFYFAGQEHRIVALPPLVRLDDQEFEDVYDFFREAMLDGEKLTSIYEELTDFTLLT